MSRLLLVRHGVTGMNNSYRFNGITDTDMSPSGYRQIEKLRNRLAKERIDAVCCSSLKRARISAEIITSERGLEVKSYPELREVDCGKVEGLTFGEVHHSFPEVARAIEEQNFAVKFPGGESLTDLETRIKRFVGELQQFKPEQTVLIVAHDGPLRVLICQLLELGMGCWWRLHLDNASLSIVNNYPQGSVLSLLNDVSHLAKGKV